VLASCVTGCPGRVLAVDANHRPVLDAIDSIVGDVTVVAAHPGPTAMHEHHREQRADDEDDEDEGVAVHWGSFVLAPAEPGRKSFIRAPNDAAPR
jgi:hypothetical protein